MMTEAKSTEERIVLAFRLATARKPKAEEIAVVRRVFEAQFAEYRKDTNKALKLLAVGEAR